MRDGRNCLSGNRALAALGFLCFWVLLAPPGWCQGTVRMEGRVRTDRGQSLPSGVSVQLETAEGYVLASQPASPDGVFRFDNIRKGPYLVTARAEGFEPAQKALDLTYSATTIFVDLILVPLARTKLAPAAPPARTDANVPGKVRREYERGVRALEAKNFPEAQAHFEKAVKEYPCYARAQMDLASALSSRGDGPRAEDALAKAVKCDPDFLDPYAQLAQLLNAEKKFAESEKVISEGLRRSPNAWQFHYQLAAAHHGQGQYAQAEGEYLKVLALNPSPPPDLHVKLADIYLKVKSYTRAYAQMQEYLRAEPNGRFAEKVKGIMREMEASGALNPSQAPAAQNPP